MRYVFGFLWVWALGVTPLVGCSEETAATGGSGGSAGTRARVCDPELCRAVDCGDADRCTRDVCDEVDGTCSHVPICDDFNDCTTEVCNPTDESCSTATPVADGTSCAGGACQSGTCVLSGSVLPCTEQGILNAIAAGDGTYTFACDGTTPVVTQATIVIDNDVILDGEGKLTVDGNCNHRVLFVTAGVTAELRNLALQGGFTGTNGGGAISNGGTLNLETVVVSGNRCSGKTCEGAGISNFSLGSLTLTDSTVFDNTGSGESAAIFNEGILNLVRSTVTNNRTVAQVFGYNDTVIIDSTISWSENFDAVGLGAGLFGRATVLNSTVRGILITVGDGSTIRNSTIVAPQTDLVGALNAPSDSTGPLTIVGSLVVGDCSGDIVSDGYNIESPGDTCGFEQGTDQVNVAAEDLNLGPLQDNGGPTQTHALLPDSVAIDVIPADMCEVDKDQRGEPRASMCDVGAFEVQEGSL